MTRRLLLSYVAITIVVLALLEVPLGIFYAQRERDRFTADVERDATVIATIYEDDLELRRIPDPTAAQRYRDRTGARVVVVDAAGISVVDTGATPPRDFSTRPEIATALTGAHATGIRRSNTLDTSLLYVAVPVASSGVVHGALRITLDASRVDARIYRFWAGLAGMAVVITAVVALVGWALARSVTRPIRQLRETATRYSGGDLSAEDGPVLGPPEIRELAATMDTMAVRLEALIAEQRSFVADASHQLRTPLTALRLRLENLQTRLSAEDAAELDSVIEESARLATLVSDLLQLARADEHSPVEVVDLRELVADRADMWSAVADERNITIDVRTPGVEVLARAVPGAVDQVLDNLLDNALNASPDLAVVQLELISGSTEHVFTVADQGPGLSDDDKERALHRFWRGDASTPGTGLGLAIARALVAGSGGRIEMTDTSGTGLRVAVHLPAADPPEPAASPPAP
ncbi:MAG: HAMP domain-containing protein [Microthrixaceae bacterium]|nr:HAMP domain-containing protein [Microthrixaceae bacterium]